MDAWVGKVLDIDLSRGDVRVESLDPDIAKNYVAGRGLAVKALYDGMDPRADALSPENRLVIAPGLLTGTGAPTSSRCFLASKSPLTSTIAFSTLGGRFGSDLKYAGYDLVVVRGRAAEPVYLSIVNDKVDLRSACHLWGRNTGETEDIVKSEAGDKWKARDTSVMCIGPAGEKLVRMAAIQHEKHHSASRGGLGAVMGSKNLKAIAVRGTGEVTVADGDLFKEGIMAFLEKLKSNPQIEALTEYGQLYALTLFNEMGILSTRNLQKGSFEGAASIGAEALNRDFLIGRLACFSCPIACIRVTRVKTGEFQSSGGGPEFETVAKLGANCGIDNLAAIVKANHICNELGMDAISVGGIIGCAMELYEKGYLPEKDVGCKLHFGNAQAMVDLVEKMGMRRGFGDVLAEGGYHLAEKYGHPELFMGVKKLDFPAHFVRALQGMGLEFATSTRGACHLRAVMFSAEAFGSDGHDRALAIEGKAAICIKRQNDYAFIDASGLCLRLIAEPTLRQYSLELMQAATGLSYTWRDARIIGERIWNVERLFNLRAGITAADDSLPSRIIEEPVSEGWAKGNVHRLGEMLPEYYRLRGWDEGGVPTPEKLAELGIALPVWSGSRRGEAIGAQKEG
jgi:aldehyde:ferredoxin oxidoreductase